MVEIRLTNTRTRGEEVFTPYDPKDVRLYLCGPTVYDRAHLGNARPVMVFDLLVRLLHHVYGADHVTYVRNFTDVDDKINDRAALTGRSIREITDETIGWYHDDMRELGTMQPDKEPRATDFIPEMISMIERLIAGGHAYEAEGHVLFSVRSFSEYGNLSGRSVDDMIAGARVEVAPFKRDPMDFVLWKPSEEGVPGWESPWSFGRPGWHIECSAMSEKLLGPTFDIHGGGIDLQFPHHENEMAQSCCANPHSDFARVWLHNEMLQVEGKKMSKSLGNFFTVRDLLDKGIVGEVIRYVFMLTHYRSPMDWTEEKRKVAEVRLNRWHRLKCQLLSDPKRKFEGKNVDDGVINALAADLNTSAVLTRLIEMDRKLERLQAKDSEDALIFFDTLAFLGFNNLDTQRMLRDQAVAKAVNTSELIESLLAARLQARTARDFARADAIRDGFATAGVIVKDTPEGPIWSLEPGFDPAVLAELAKAQGS